MLDPKRECVEQAQWLLCINFIEQFFQLAHLDNTKPWFRLFYKKNAASVVNLKWLRGVWIHCDI